MLEWQQKEIFKKQNGTFLIQHGEHQYHVCPKEIDPIGIYDIKTVEKFWNSLPDDDPRKKIEE